MKWLITGAAGFVGTNLSIFLVESGASVVLIDDLSRPDVSKNAEILLSKYKQKMFVVDVSDSEKLTNTLKTFNDIDVIVHLAGQVSFMQSLINPRRDLEINVLGTLNILEYVRNYSPETIVIGVSSNKIYGALDYIKIVETKTRYVAPEYPGGFDENLHLDFHGPYGCSKGSADQYLLDYNRMFGLRTVSLRQSSIYGPYQRPRNDQGWIAFFVGELKKKSHIKLNGRGLQVRDILHVSDWINLIQHLVEMDHSKFGSAFNVGGGPDNSISIIELIDFVGNELGCVPDISFGDSRPSDQKIFVSDNTKIEANTGWKVKTDKFSGIRDFINRENS